MLEKGMELELAQYISLVGTALIVGLLMGSTSIGGILMVPMVALIIERPIEQIVPVGMMVAFFSALAGVSVFARNGHFAHNSALSSFLPAALGAFAGSLLLPFVSAGLITVGILAACGLSIANGLRRQPTATRRYAPSGRGIMGASGLVGVGSALSGTSGPVLFVPPALILGHDPKETIGFAQFIQIPITLFATLGYAAFGAIDYWLVVILSPAVVIGAFFGARYTQRIAPEDLRSIMMCVMSLVGVLTLLA